MLVLSRKQGERLVVGKDITITVTKCGRNRVVIGIEAPKDVPVQRGELIEAEPLATACGPQAKQPTLSVA